MAKRILHFLAAFAFLAIARTGLAQNADKNTAAPTKNDLKLRLTEPKEGATVTGNSVRVTIDYNRQIFGAGQGTHFGEPNFPHAIFDVFLDNKLQQSLKSGEANVATIENVSSGSHKIAVVAKNISGEVIDRKEVAFQAMPATAASSSAPPAPARAPAPVIAETQPAPPAAEPAPSAPAAPARLPQTGSSAPRSALAGLVLVGMGLLIWRKAR